MKHPLSIEAFADWAAMQPADREYIYCFSNGCAYYQYLKAVGIDVYSVSPERWSRIETSKPLVLAYTSLPYDINRAVRTHPWTFGALTKRLIVAIDDTKKPFDNRYGHVVLSECRRQGVN
jgi:hypothetical protein